MEALAGAGSRYQGGSREELSLIVDGVVVRYAVVAGFREGVIAYWPPETPDEVLEFAENTYLKTRSPGYMLFESPASQFKYLFLLLGDKLLLLVLDKRVDAEELGYRLTRVLYGRAFTALA